MVISSNTQVLAETVQPAEKFQVDINEHGAGAYGAVSPAVDQVLCWVKADRKPSMTTRMASPRRRARWRIVFVSSTRPNIRPLTGSGTRSSYSTPRRDITLKGTPGRPILVVIMIFGVTLFLRLVRALLQPQKVRFACPTCGYSAMTSTPFIARRAGRRSTFRTKVSAPNCAVAPPLIRGWSIYEASCSSLFFLPANKIMPGVQGRAEWGTCSNYR